MAWKMTEDGTAVLLIDGNPVRIRADGTEETITEDGIATDRKEAATRKERIRELEKTLEPFKGIEKPSEWLQDAEKALDMMRNAPEKEKALEDQVRARVEAATKPLHEKLGVSSKETEALRMQLERESVTNAFARSTFVNEKFVNPALASDLFGGRFALKDGKVVAIGDDGQPVFGAEGIAGFDEALATLVESSPYKSAILKGSQGSGSGATTNGGTSSRYGKPSSLAECKTKDEQIAYLREKSGTA